MAVPVLMLQTLAGEGGASGRGADQETLGLGVAGLPDLVAHALEAEHRVEGVEGDRVDAVVGVGGARRDEAGHAARLAQALFEDRAGGALVVEQQVALIDRVVELANVAVDACLAEERLHAESPRLVRHDGHDVLAELGVLEQLGEQVHVAHGGGHLALPGALVQVLEHEVGLAGLGLHLDLAARHAAAQLGAAFPEVLHLGTVVGGTVERRRVEVLVRDRNSEAGAEGQQFLVVQFLLAVGDVAALAGLAQAVALDRLGQDHRRLRLAVGRGLLVGRVDLLGIVAAALQLADLLVAVVGHQLEQLGVLAEEVLPDVGAVADGVALHLAVEDLFHASLQQAGGVAGEQFVPLAAPHNLDHVPACAAEGRLELADDLAVAAHRPVETLQVAVDHEDQVAELFTRGQRDRAEALRLVHLAVAEQRPYFASRTLAQLAVDQVVVEAGQVDGLDRSQTHADRRELPEVGHQEGMRIARQPAFGIEFATEP